MHIFERALEVNKQTFSCYPADRTITIPYQGEAAIPVRNDYFTEARRRFWHEINILRGGAWWPFWYEMRTLRKRGSLFGTKCILYEGAVAIAVRNV